MILWLNWIFLAVAVVRAATDQSDDSAPIMGEVGKSVTIPCRYKLTENEQLYTLRWHKGDEDIQAFVMNKEIYKRNLTRMLVNNNTHELTLVDLQYDDAGKFSCSVLTSKGSSTRTEYLQVFAVPNISVRVLPVVLQEDFQTHRKKENLAECVAVGGSPPFSIKWVTYPGGDLIIGDTFRTELVNRDNKELLDATLLLTILPDPLRNNGRSFSCVVEDAIGRETVQDITADVSASPAVASFPAKNGVPIYAERGERKEFPCEVTGVPSPKVAWYSGTKKVAEGVGKAVLYIEIATLDDAGQYTCVGHNKEGNDSNTFHLIVHGPPVILNEKKNVANETKTIAVNPAWRFLNISCQAEALPIADIRWEMDGRNITNAIIDTKRISDKKIIISTAHLELFDNKENTKRVHTVQCIATNTLGQSIKTFIVSFPDATFLDPRFIVGATTGGVVIFALAVVAICYILSSKRREDASVSVKENSKKRCSTCTPVCGFSRSKKTANKDNKSPCGNEQIKEAIEKGTEEEKKKLTGPEEYGFANESDPSENRFSKEDEVKIVKPRKPLISFRGLHCCQSSKKILKEEDRADEQATTNSAEKEEKILHDKKIKDISTEPDSGKVETLNKVAEETK